MSTVHTMNSTLGTINAVAAWIPSKIRGVIYALIGVFWMVEAIWNLIPNDGNGDKIAASISLLGLIMAVTNTDLVPDPRPQVIPDQVLEDMRVDAGESTIITILAVLAIIVLVALILGWISF